MRCYWCKTRPGNSALRPCRLNAASAQAQRLMMRGFEVYLAHPALSLYPCLQGRPFALAAGVAADGYSCDHCTTPNTTSAACDPNHIRINKNGNTRRAHLRPPSPSGTSCRRPSSLAGTCTRSPRDQCPSDRTPSARNRPCPGRRDWGCCSAYISSRPLRTNASRNVSNRAA
jgi:hypothetical protein